MRAQAGTPFCHASFHSGLFTGLIYTWISSFIMKGREPWTLTEPQTDSEEPSPLRSACRSGIRSLTESFPSDLLTSVDRSGTSHDHDQPAHLRIRPEFAAAPTSTSLPVSQGQSSCSSARLVCASTVPARTTGRPRRSS